MLFKILPWKYSVKHKASALLGDDNPLFFKSFLDSTLILPLPSSAYFIVVSSPISSSSLGIDMDFSSNFSLTFHQSSSRSLKNLSDIAAASDTFKSQT